MVACQCKDHLKILSKTNLSRNVAVRVEEAEGIISAAVDCDTNFGDIIVCVRCCLCSAKRTFIVGITDVELVVVLGVWLQVLCFDLRYCQPSECKKSLQNITYLDREINV